MIVKGEVSDSWVYGLLSRAWAPLQSRSAAARRGNFGA